MLLGLASGPHNITGFGVSVGYLAFDSGTLWGIVDGVLRRYGLQSTGAFESNTMVAAASPTAFSVHPSSTYLGGAVATYVSSDGGRVVEAEVAITSWDPLTWGVVAERTPVTAPAGITVRSVAARSGVLAWSEAGASTRRIVVRVAGTERTLTATATTPTSALANGPALHVLPGGDGRTVVVAQGVSTTSSSTGTLRAWEYTSAAGVRALTIPTHAAMARPGGIMSVAGSVRLALTETSTGQLSALPFGCF